VEKGKASRTLLKGEKETFNALGLLVMKKRATGGEGREATKKSPRKETTGKKYKKGGGGEAISGAASKNFS